VFPVLALKALALVGLGGEALRRVRRHGLVYALGIVVSFWALARSCLRARASGAEIGWGFQLQSPTVIAILAGRVLLDGARPPRRRDDRRLDHGRRPASDRR
jgi:thiol:disulfide interchange protein DsbD